MRKEGGMEHIVNAIEKMGKKHDEHIAEYDPTNGADNARRLTGLHETARSVRIRIKRSARFFCFITIVR